MGRREAGDLEDRVSLAVLANCGGSPRLAANAFSRTWLESAKAEITPRSPTIGVVMNWR
jgi:hypothetical protein